MSKLPDNNKPIYLQIREKIEDQILRDILKEGEQAPSTNQLVNFYKVNHQTVAKGVNQLVDEGILYKKRGVGMFVSEGAKETLIKKRKEQFVDNYIIHLVEEAKILGITDEELITLIKKAKERV
ncbi:GntR family transcriptional regulator [Pallidibacillus thermolactis]|uniref:GntR family transcriptional regulator n=1 Tax=Pallidibacillus thermolactis TaxID=251051 RepID=UPI0021D8D8E7|nr:GntR family transcriptional regulator [Pallidibacillus thermolactis]MCU9601162.1 GntR family transcriptional regulator [Pallidibacillus thermolactis subsp. kokeshiiformis]MED1672332.1 GntR family transcriptional regulator [Pallidibacillus thermolactis subsp. kokeshiiformis]